MMIEVAMMQMIGWIPLVEVVLVVNTEVASVVIMMKIVIDVNSDVAGCGLAVSVSIVVVSVTSVLWHTVDALLLPLTGLAPRGHVAKTKTGPTLLVLRLVESIQRDRPQLELLSLLLVGVVVSGRPAGVLLGVDNLFLLGQLVIWGLFLFRQFPPLLTKQLVDGGRFLDDTLSDYLWPLFLHKDHEWIQRFLDVLLLNSCRLLLFDGAH